MERKNARAKEELLKEMISKNSEVQRITNTRHLADIRGKDIGLLINKATVAASRAD